MSAAGGTAFHVTATGSLASGPGGILHTVSVNTAGTTASLTLYDGASAEGNEIAVITPAAGTPVTLTYDAVLGKGLYAVVTGTGLDATVTILPEHDFSS